MFFYVSQVYLAEIPELWLDPASLYCIKQHSIETSVLSTILDDNYLVTDEVEDLYPLYECLYKEHKYLNEKNEFDERLIVEIETKLIPIINPDVKDAPETSKKVFEKCRNLEDEKLGKRIIKFYNCLVTGIKEN